MSTVTEAQVLAELGGIIADIVGDAFDAELELSDEISLLYDLGLESVEVIALLEQIHMRYAFPLDRVLRMAESGATVQDLRVRDILEFVKERST